MSAGHQFCGLHLVVGDYRPVEGANRSEEQVLTSTAVYRPLADLSRDKGLNCGLTIFYAGGSGNNHLIGCHQSISRQLERR